MRQVCFPTPDVSTPVVVFRAESYCALGVLRSLGRLGVKVYGIDSRAHAYGLRSRYCAGAFLWDFDGSPPDATVDFLKQVARRVGGRPLLLPTFDPRSLLVADHAEELAEHYVFARPEAGAARRLYDKREMHRICGKQGIPTADTRFPRTAGELEDAMGTMRFPMLLKGIDGDRLMRRADGLRMMIVHRSEDLRTVFARWDEPGHPNLMLQELIPGDADQLWMLAGYFDSHFECRFAVTARKLRQLPLDGGITALGACDPCEAIVESTRRIVRAVGYRGVLDVDFRYDPRDGLHKMLDVNPRPGAHFRLFADGNGLDVVRACYLDLTGQALPPVEPKWGRRFVVEDVDLYASVGLWRKGRLTLSGWLKSYRGVAETAYVAWDDPVPSTLFLRDLAWKTVRAVYARLRSRVGRLGARIGRKAPGPG
jgi:predicted ATP-grasp superfamily ATP-dependent carboligase